jgi:TetR/AcrR family transcriptional regulator, fatty acid metabolism regulator protein
MRKENTPRVQKQESFIETARRRQLIECAIDTIASLGYARASLSEIGRRAKTSKGVISYHFASKDALIQEVVRTIFATADAFMKSETAGGSSAADLLRSSIRSNVEFLRTHRKEVLALVHILTTARDRTGKPLMDPTKYDPVIEAVEEILKRGQKDRDFRRFSTRVMAVAIRGAIDGIPGQMMAHPDLDLSAYAEEMVVLFDRATRSKRA